MPRYFCDYCDTYLTHDSAQGRKQHMRGWKHREAVKQYYEPIRAAWEQADRESIIDAQKDLAASAAIPFPAPVMGMPGMPPPPMGMPAGFPAAAPPRPPLSGVIPPTGAVPPGQVAQMGQKPPGGQAVPPGLPGQPGMPGMPGPAVPMMHGAPPGVDASRPQQANGAQGAPPMAPPGMMPPGMLPSR
mmetsp:Transcript_8872/g.33507  ORF Transcript_8872/g.33507 Transcript_8872/m.33507 type:complete len:187 (-) Transcript_8872:682-1242(-)